MSVLFPREASKLIANTCRDVTIKHEGIRKIARLIYDGIIGKQSAIDLSRWQLNELNPKGDDEASINWIFVVDVLNFSFWSGAGQPKYAVNFKGHLWTGYWSLCAAINRALQEGIPITTPSFYASVGEAQLAQILRSDTEGCMPMLRERLDNLHEAGCVLIKKYDGSFLNVLKQCDGSAQTLLKMIVTDFPSFRDEASYEGDKVGLYKRAQIVVGDIWACLSGKGLANFSDIDSITMFADYRIPQVLVWYGALEYSQNLMEILQKETLMKSGDRLEVEIRGCSIWAVELIVSEVKRMVVTSGNECPHGINAILVDHYLWDHRRDYADKMEHIPIHCIRCIYY